MTLTHLEWKKFYNFEPFPSLLDGEGDVETQGMFHNDSQHILSWPLLCVTMTTITTTNTFYQTEFYLYYYTRALLLVLLGLNF